MTYAMGVEMTTVLGIDLDSLYSERGDATGVVVRLLVPLYDIYLAAVRYALDSGLEKGRLTRAGRGDEIECLHSASSEESTVERRITVILAKYCFLDIYSYLSVTVVVMMGVMVMAMVMIVVVVVMMAAFAMTAASRTHDLIIYGFLPVIEVVQTISLTG